MDGSNQIEKTTAEINPSLVESDIQCFLLKDEKVERAFQFEHDYYVFTSRRLIIANDGHRLNHHKALQTHCIVYKNIKKFSVDSVFSFGLKADITIWVTGSGTVVRHFGHHTGFYEIQSVLADYIVKSHKH